MLHTPFLSSCSSILNNSSLHRHQDPFGARSRCAPNKNVGPADQLFKILGGEFWTVGHLPQNRPKTTSNRHIQNLYRRSISHVEKSRSLFESSNERSARYGP